MSHVEELVWKLIRQTRVLLVENRSGSLSDLEQILDGLYDCVVERAATTHEVRRSLSDKEFGAVFVSSNVGNAFVDVLASVNEIRPNTPVVLVREAACPLEPRADAGFFGVVRSPCTADVVQQVFGTFRISARSRPAAPGAPVGTGTFSFSPA